ncbi:dGTPase [Thermoanaerobacter thermohydrosulfuricus]|uniref:Deoxyguanosinetriphosphate triphosphohydrolase-like protein n=1 Tax=Thermoanaerobacter thermohydrosulfuricus TaxID=1516 RepID=A0A1G7P0K5_THETY|nr:dNTP triphosphohydrolase [Thermoanaerobacter thermohydrosulfuricus]SDF79825.1 dGTPase [Thermoanaerobacter thermohydrosulfuricus]
MSNKWYKKGIELMKKIDDSLAPYAVKNLNKNIRRKYSENIANENDDRTCFQHDRDRIIHSRAFRRLRSKTQVFLSAKGDHYRTRLSHTLEVSQIARSIARVFSLNEDLVEAIALGHDLGHTPFGHIGERILNEILSGDKMITKKCGGFKHNYNSLKVADSFEKSYNDFRGLNLTNYTREGILKHTNLYFNGSRIYDPKLDLDDLNPDLDVPSFLEGQVVAIADEIAQITHDLEDAFRAGIISIDDKDLNEIKVFNQARKDTQTNADMNVQQIRSGLIRVLINKLVRDVIDTTAVNLEKISFNPENDKLFYWIVDFSEEMKKQYENIKKILTEKLMYSYEISRMDKKGEMYIEKLFEAYYSNPGRLPDYVFENYNSLNRERKITRSTFDKGTISYLQNDIVFIRTIAEHIAGMTDIYAIDEYRRLYLPDVTSITNI